jgi:hypothetical protein
MRFHPGNRTRTFLSGSVLCKTSENTHASSEPRSANRNQIIMWSATNQMALQSKLGHLTAHSYCLRIINHCRTHVIMPQEFLHGSDVISIFEQVRGE